MFNNMPPADLVTHRTRDFFLHVIPETYLLKHIYGHMAVVASILQHG